MDRGVSSPRALEIGGDRRRDMAGRKVKVDREHLRGLLRGMKRHDHLSLLDRAIDVLAEDALVSLFEPRVGLRAMVRAADRSPAGLLAAVRSFHKATLAGEHYEDFDVNSRNSSETSVGTEAWIAECERLMTACLEAEAAGGSEAAETVGDAYRLLFDLLQRIDRGEEIVFFADEGGSWQVDLAWDRILPSYFRCRARSASPAEYAKEAVGLIDDFAGHDAKRMLGRARGAATSAQRAALAKARPRRGG